MSDDGGSGGVRSVARAVRALQLIAEQGELGVTDLGRGLGVHKATASRLAATLAAGGLVERDPASDRYRLGSGLVRLVGAALVGTDLVREELAERTRETVNLGVVSGDGVVYLDQVSSGQLIASTNWVGRRTPLHCSSSGKVFLAHMPEQLLQQVLGRPLEALTARTVTDPRPPAPPARGGPPARLRDHPGGARAGAQRRRGARAPMGNDSAAGMWMNGSQA
jgi:DNA-binding IclR family transcriptional regulator